MRPDFDTYAMRMAYVVAQRATCPRRHVGAVLMDPENRIVATGYNGSPRKQDSCDEAGCLLIEGHCRRTLHAESNCLDFAGRFARNCTLFCTITPCFDCAKRIVNSGVLRVVWDEHYESRYGKSSDVASFLDRAGVEVTRFDPNHMTRYKQLLALVDVPPDITSATPPGGVSIPPGACAVHRFDGNGPCVVCGISGS